MNDISLTPTTSRAWGAKLAAYRNPSWPVALWELGLTLAVVLTASWSAAFAFEVAAWWLLVPAIPVAGGAVVRLFMIQHDCGHLSFVPGRRANDVIGRVLGIITLTPYDFWRHAHNLHHAHSGDLDQRGFGDVTTLTLLEYKQRSPLGRLRYWLYRHPLVLFGIGPAYTFALSHRLPLGRFHDRRSWVSVMGTNAAIAAYFLLWWQATGSLEFLAIYIPTMWVAATVGVWLFFVQHQFEETYWERTRNWSFHDAALYGSSYLVLPAWLNWFTANIGIHHVHHLVNRIPFYRLGQVLRDFPALAEIGRVSFVESLAVCRLVLWDEAAGRMLTFREARHRLATDTNGEIKV